MLAPKVATPQTKSPASSTNSVGHSRSTLLLSQSNGDQATPRCLAQHDSGLTAGGSGEHQEPGVFLDAHSTRGLSWDLSKVPVFPPDRSRGSQTPSRSARPVPARIRPKLLVGQVNDPFEHEADRVADEVLRFPDREISVGAAPRQISRKCAACEDDEQLLRKASHVAEPAPAEAPSFVREVLGSPGQPLDAATRAYFEPRFRHDFTQVRVHTDSEAAASARAVQARAFTVGPDIAFGPGQYAPATQTGLRLLAHELTHVVQQESGGAACATRLFRQPDLTGSGLTLTSPEPRSLRNSLDVGGLSLPELALEVTLIEQWLNAHSERTQQSDDLRSELKRLQGPLKIKSTPFELRFYNAWNQAEKAVKKEVFRRDKDAHGSSITRGLMKVKEVAVSSEEVWKYGIADGLFQEQEKKRVGEWSQSMATKTFDKRYESARYGRIYGDEARYDQSGTYRDDPTEIWNRGVEYGLFLPSEKASVLRIHYSGRAAANLLTQRIKMVDPKSPDAARVIDAIHDFTRNPAVVLLGPEVEKLLGPYGYKYSGEVDARYVAAEINKAYAKSLPQGQVRHTGSTKERWDECLRRRNLGPNNLELAEFDPRCFQSEEEFVQELTRRIKEFRELYKNCGRSRPSHFECRDRVAGEYFPAGQARQDAIRSWAYGELEIYKGVVAGGVVSQSGFHFAHDVLGWSSQRSAAFGGALSTVANLGATAAYRQAVLRKPPANTPQEPTPITEVVKNQEPIPKPDQPVRVTPKVSPAPDAKATTRQLMLEIEQAQQRYDRLKEKASQAEANYAKRLRPAAGAKERRAQQLTEQESDLLAAKRSLEEARKDALSKLNQAKQKLRVVQPPEGAPKHGAAGLAQEPKYLAEVVASGVPARLVDKGTPVIDAALVGKPELHSVKSIVPSQGADAAVRLAESGSPRDLATRIGGKVTEALMDRGSDKWNRLRNQWNTTKRSTYADQFGYELPQNRDEISFVVYVRVVTPQAPSPTAQKAVATSLAQWLSKTQKVPPNFSWRVIYVTN